LLPLADYLGSTQGYKHEKMDIPLDVEKGAVLPVPVLKNSPWVFELEVKQSIPLNGSEVFFCKIRNVLAAKELVDETKNISERMCFTAPVTWIGGSGSGQYFFINPDSMSNTGEISRNSLSLGGIK